MPAIQMLHEKDPKDVIWDEVKDWLEGSEIGGPRILLAVYKRPERTASGFILPTEHLNEDVHQGKTCLVLQVGPTAVVDLAGGNVKVGDWVIVRQSDGLRHDFGPRECRLVTDAMICMRVPRPDLVW